MGIKAQELGVDLRGMTVSVQKEMSKDRAAPHRCAPVRKFTFRFRPIRRTARCWSKRRLNCPVHKSLPP